MPFVSALIWVVAPRQDGDLQAAYRPRDIEKQREPARTSDQPELQARGGFRAFVQVNGLGCLDLGDRRSRVQISAATRRTAGQGRSLGVSPPGIVLALHVLLDTQPDLRRWICCVTLGTTDEGLGFAQGRVAQYLDNLARRRRV